MAARYITLPLGTSGQVRAAGETHATIDGLVIRWRVTSHDGSYTCDALAQLSYPIGDGGDRRLDRLSSGGLSGIDVDDLGDPYCAEVEDDELADLREHLTHFGITPNDHEWAILVGSARRITL